MGPFARAVTNATTLGTGWRAELFSIDYELATACATDLRTMHDVDSLKMLHYEYFKPHTEISPTMYNPLYTRSYDPTTDLTIPQD